MFGNSNKIIYLYCSNLVDDWRRSRGLAGERMCWDYSINEGIMGLPSLGNIRLTAQRLEHTIGLDTKGKSMRILKIIVKIF